MSRALAMEFAVAKTPIRVNTIFPGCVDTPLLMETLATIADSSKAVGLDDIINSLVSVVPLGRLAQAQEIANDILFLASSERSYITGADIVVDGGRSEGRRVGKECDNSVDLGGRRFIKKKINKE